MCIGSFSHDDPRFSCDCHLWRDEEEDDRERAEYEDWADYMREDDEPDWDSINDSKRDDYDEDDWALV